MPTFPPKFALVLLAISIASTGQGCKRRSEGEVGGVDALGIQKVLQENDRGKAAHLGLEVGRAGGDRAVKAASLAGDTLREELAGAAWTGKANVFLVSGPVPSSAEFLIGMGEAGVTDLVRALEPSFTSMIAGRPLRPERDPLPVEVTGLRLWTRLGSKAERPLRLIVTSGVAGGNGERAMLAAVALGCLGAPLGDDSVRILAVALGNAVEDRTELYAAAAEALYSGYGVEERQILGLFKDRDAKVRYAGLQIARRKGLLWQSEFVDSLRVLVTDDSLRVALASALDLGAMGKGGEPVREVVRRGLRSNELELRLVGTQRLEKWQGDDEWRKAMLIERLTDEDGRVQRLAREGLEAIARDASHDK